MKKLFASPLGTALKVFISTVLSLWMAMDDLWAFDMHTLKALAGAGMMSALPVIINWINPNYQGYGVSQSPDQIALGKNKEE